MDCLYLQVKKSKIWSIIMFFRGGRRAFRAVYFQLPGARSLLLYIYTAIIIYLQFAPLHTKIKNS
jgi:hypothetical protein